MWTLNVTLKKNCHINHAKNMRDRKCFFLKLKQDPDPGFKILICRFWIRPKMGRIRNRFWIRPKMGRIRNPDQDIGTGTVPYGIIRIRIGTVPTASGFKSAALGTSTVLQNYK